jgi:hypothetical protein
MKSLLLICVLSVTSFSFGQDSFFRNDAGLGAAMTINSFKSYGISASSEPKFFFNENISVGIRLEGNILIGGSLDQVEDKLNVGLGVRAAVLGKGEYYFGKGNTKPFVGLMAGYYTQANTSTSIKGSDAGVSMSAVRAFGFAPEVGITFGNFRLSGIYHFVPSKRIMNVTVSTGETQAHEIGNSYLVLQLGFRTFGIGDK